MRRPSPKHLAQAFTLVEILVVVVIIIILIAIMVPTFSYARRQARISATASLMANINTGIDAYRADFSGTVPPTRGPTNGGPPGPSGYGMNGLARALSGYQPGPFPASSNDWSVDGHDGPGFKMSAQSRVYGPYFAGGRNLKIYASAADFPNPAAAATYSSGNWPSEMQVHHAAFVDAWGLPIFYFVGNASMQRATAVNSNPLLVSHPSVEGWGWGIFQKCNPDTSTSVTYTVNGVPIQSRLVPYTPPDAWNTNTTPWGLSLSLSESDADSNGVITTPANPKPGIAFRRLIGMGNPTGNVERNERLRGRNSYLIFSAGPDNQFYTGDEIIAEGR